MSYWPPVYERRFPLNRKSSADNPRAAYSVALEPCCFDPGGNGRAYGSWCRAPVRRREPDDFDCTSSGLLNNVHRHAIISLLPVLALAHRRRAQKFARGTQYALGRTGNGYQPLVIAALSNQLQAYWHAETIEACGQSRRA